MITRKDNPKGQPVPDEGVTLKDMAKVFRQVYDLPPIDTSDLEETEHGEDESL